MSKKKTELAVGEEVPGFETASTSGENFSLETCTKKNLVIYSYPKDSTPGCTTEGQDFSRLYPKFKKAGTEVVGVSRDSLKSHEKFKTKMGFNFHLLSDEDEALCTLFNVIK